MRGRRPLLLTTALLALLLLVGPAAAGATETGLRPGAVLVSGNRLVDTGTGSTMRLLGANRYALASSCLDGNISDGPLDAPSADAMATWKMTAVRVPINQDCWLGSHGLPKQPGGGTNVQYQDRVVAYAHLLESRGFVVILESHFASVGGTTASRYLAPMPDQSAVGFLTSLATRFKGDDDIVFDPFNEPHPDSTFDGAIVGNTTPWQCWRDGCSRTYTDTAAEAEAGTPGTPITYTAVGMQALVNAIRSTGNNQPILLSGLSYGSDLSQWLTYKPTDNAGQLIASVHLYEYRDTADPNVWVGAEGRPHVTGETPAQAAQRRTAAWDATLAPVAQQVPLVAGELGEYDCDHDFLDQFEDWADLHGAGYLGWTWNAVDGTYWFCDGFNRGGPSLINSYDGTPTTYGQGLKERLALDAIPDTTPPSITITSPTDGQPIPQGSAPATAFTCADAGRGVSSCTGQATLDTADGGFHTFTVTAVDKVGNATSKAVGYFVTVPPPPATTTTTTTAPATTQAVPVVSPPPPAAAITFAIPAVLSTSTKGVFAVPVRCAPAAACAGRLSVVVDLPATKTRKAATLTLARVPYALRAGRSGRVAVQLNATGRVRLKRAVGGRLKVRLVLTPSSAALRPVTRTVTLRRRP
jgi:hypothetical protein